MAAGITVVLPNFNGVSLLRDNLPPLLDALDHWGGIFEVIVVDDGSTDSSVAVLREEFPRVRLLVNARNLGFPGTCNAGFAEARYPMVLCLNTDVRVERDFLAPLLEHFANDPELFAVTPKVLVEREGVNQGLAVAHFSKGFLKGGFVKIDDDATGRESLYAVGASAVYDREKLLQLGGYSDIYAPYLFEDADLSYRAWTRGWPSRYDPRSTVWHYANATLSREKKRRTRQIYFRNRFLFHWTNLSDPLFLTLNLLHTAKRLLVSFLWLDFTYYRGFFAALGLLGRCLTLRGKLAPAVLTDREILKRTAP
jgi:GT2 family glycosyltransferase